MKNINQFIEEHPEMSYAELAKATGLSAEACRKRYRRIHPAKVTNAQNQTLSPEQQVSKDLALTTLRSSKDKVETKYREALRLIKDQEKIIEAIRCFKDTNISRIVPDTTESTNATAVAVCSDFHFEEEVKPETVNGLNEFNLDIARSRSDRFFVNTAKLIKAKQKSIKVDTLVLGLLGDFITGNIHEENVETAQLPPAEALVLVETKLASGIQYLLDNTNVKLVIHCHLGNHPRITKKMRHATSAGNNLEWVMYHFLASHFKGNKRIEWFISPAYHSYCDIGGFVIRFHHGHDVRFGGGVGGLSIPLNKAIAQWNKAKRADLDVLGHWHQLRYFGNAIVNGSLIGFNAYALSIKADFEKPKQAFFLVNNARKEVTDFSPVWLD